MATHLKVRNINMILPASLSLVQYDKAQWIASMMMLALEIKQKQKQVSSSLQPKY